MLVLFSKMLTISKKSKAQKCRMGKKNTEQSINLKNNFWDMDIEEFEGDYVFMGPFI